MKKISISIFVSFFIGLSLLAIGVILAIKSDYGITVSTSTPYVLSLKFTDISLGTFNYIVQGFVFILLMIVMKKFCIKYFFAFITSIIFGYFLDFFNFLMKNITIFSHMYRVSLFIVSIVTISLGLVFLIKSNIPLMPFDLFVKQVSIKYNINLGKFKIGFDLTLLTIAISLSFLFFGKLEGIGIGTVLSALTIGLCIDKIMKIVDKFFIIKYKKDNSLLSKILS